MQEAVTLFPHSISHSNNGEQLISIEFLPLFNRFTVLFELSEQASKQVFKFQLVFSAYPMIGPLWHMMGILVVILKKTKISIRINLILISQAHAGIYG